MQGRTRTRGDFSPKHAQALATKARVRCVEVTRDSKFGHLGPDFSAIDLISTLYLGILRFPEEDLGHPDRDRFVLSKGHAALALYTVLIELGWWQKNQLTRYGRTGGRLGGHPSSAIQGVETSTGALGHGLPFAVGCALGSKLHATGSKTFVLVGDGELQEGSNWEAAMLASSKQLDDLTVIVDRNRLQQGGSTEAVIRLEPLKEKWESFGWAVEEINGHDHAAIHECCSRLPLRRSQPTCIIANTVKGKGVSFMEGKAEWHHKLPSPSEAESALNELLRGEESHEAIG